MRLWAAARWQPRGTKVTPATAREDRPLPSPQTSRYLHIVYQHACEERRQLAFEVGELSRQLTDALCAAGWGADEARNADVHELARAGSR